MGEKIKCHNQFCALYIDEECQYTHIAQLLINDCKARKNYELIYEAKARN